MEQILRKGEDLVRLIVERPKVVDSGRGSSGAQPIKHHRVAFNHGVINGERLPELAMGWGA